MPILFVKLTSAGIKDDVYVNLTKVTQMYIQDMPGYAPCTVICTSGNAACYVEETPDEIMRRALEVIAYGDDCI